MTTSNQAPLRTFGILSVVLSLAVLAPSVAAQAVSPLDALVTEGLRANLGLAQQRFAVDRSEAAIREARGLYFPSLTLNARYTERSGDVTDLGDLVNPAYAGLNRVIGQNRYPTDLRFQLPRKQETTLHLAEPIFQPAIGAKVQIQKSLRNGEAAQLGLLRRRLAADIRLAYLNHLKALRLRDLYDSTLVLVTENVRINQSLLDNGKATPDAVLRARAEQSAVAQARRDAAHLADAARQSLNVLLHRALDAPLDDIADSVLGIGLTVPLDSAQRWAAGHREELAQVDAGIGAAHSELKLANASFLPSLVAAVDYGIQGDQYQVQGNQAQLLASIVLRWDLFNGGQDRSRRAQAHFELEQFTTQREHVREEIALDVRTSYDAAAVAQASIATAHDRLVSARRAYELMARKFAEGAASLVEYIDARTAYTDAGLNEIITTYDFYQRCVEFERAAALYPVGSAEGEED